MARDHRRLAQDAGKKLIVVATPGRLLDHLENTAGVAAMVREVQTFVLDEFDTLLDMGFRPDITKIVSYLPVRERRQTMLFSATLPSSVLSIAHSLLKPDFATVCCVTGASDSGQPVLNLDIDQSYLSCSLSAMFPLLMAVIREHTAKVADHKIIVFFSTARITQWAATLFNLARLPVLEIHSRKSQAYVFPFFFLSIKSMQNSLSFLLFSSRNRTKVSDQFRAQNKLIMFSSDVSARGMDYPGVSMVVQVGTPTNTEQYIHRIGRTARAGLTGEATLILADFEADNFLKRDGKGLPLHPRALPQQPLIDAASRLVASTAPMLDYELGTVSYQSFLGFYGSISAFKRDKAGLVALANLFARDSMHLRQQPALLKRTVGKMGLTGTSGLLTC